MGLNHLSLVRWRLLVAFVVIVVVGIAAWAARATLFPVVRQIYAVLPTISVVFGISASAIGWLHARETAKNGLAPSQASFRIRLLGPSVDPILEAITYAAAFHTSGSVMGRLFFDSEFSGIPIAERLIFTISLGSVMFWSMRQPVRQFIETIVDAGVEARPSSGPE